MNTRGAMMLQRIPGGGMISRITPQLPAHSMKTFEVRQPIETHFRNVSCDEAQCSHKANGWITGFDLSQPGRFDAANTYGKIATKLGRKFKVAKVGDNVTFTFEPGQECLEGHRVALDRPPLFIVRGGDWRGNPRREVTMHKTGADFEDDWRNSQDKIFNVIERG